MDPNLRSLAYEAAAISVQASTADDDEAGRLVYKFKKMFAYGNGDEKMRVLRARSRMDREIRKLVGDA